MTVNWSGLMFSLANKQSGPGLTSLWANFLFQSCGLWILSCGFALTTYKTLERLTQLFFSLQNHCVSDSSVSVVSPSPAPFPNFLGSWSFPPVSLRRQLYIISKTKTNKKVNNKKEKKKCVCRLLVMI